MGGRVGTGIAVSENRAPLVEAGEPARRVQRVKEKLVLTFNIFKMFPKFA